MAEIKVLHMILHEDPSNKEINTIKHGYSEPGFMKDSDTLMYPTP